MISEKIHALFEFIDYLDANKAEYIDVYIPLCEELNNLDIQRSELRPKSNYIDKQKYDKIQKEISEKFQPITKNIYLPILAKLRELKIWSGEDVFTSIWNNNSSAIYDFRESFECDDVPKILAYKQKYLNFRKETNSNFLCLQFVLTNLDEIYKALFDFFKDTSEDEFASFEAKTVEVDNFQDALKTLMDNKGKDVRFSIPHESLFNCQNINQYPIQLPNIKNEIIMGHKIQVGDITNNSGQIVIGQDIRVSDSLSGKNETANKISELIDLIRRQQDIETEQKESLITNFDSVKQELFEEQPSKPQIFKWLANAKEILEKLVLSHEVVQAVDWIYTTLNFVFH